MSTFFSDFRSNQYIFFLITFSVVTVFTFCYSLLFAYSGIDVVSDLALILGGLYFLYVVLGFFTKKIILLFRLGVISLEVTFFIYAFYTGGIESSYVYGFLIPSLIPFFYRPYLDRSLFIVFSLLCVIVQFYLSETGMVKNQLAPDDRAIHSLMVSLLVFFTVYTYVILLRQVIVKKNRLLHKSLHEIKEATQKLIHGEKMASLGVMSAGVAHEINNPLNFIKGGIQMLAKKLDGSKDHEPYIEAVEEGIRRASSIVNSLGHFSRETSAMDEECDLHEIIENCLVMLQHKLKYKVNVIKKFSVSDHLKLVGNEGKLHQAILNIISNAEQAITNKGTITIDTLAKKDHLKLSISDTGIGIDIENLNKISDPFFTTKPAGSGTGLGLSITYKILEEHRAKINVSSEPSKGTTFTVIFELDKRFK